MNAVVLVGIIVDVVFLAIVILGYCFVREHHSRKACKYAVTLKNNEGAFIALCTHQRRGTWTFEDVIITPTNPGGAHRAAAPGRLYVPTANILYYQEITQVANVSQ